MKKLILSLAIILGAMMQGFGQTDESYKATLKKMMQVGGTEATFQAAIKQMLGMFKQQKSEVPESFWTEFEAEFSKTSIDDLVNMLAPVYQKHITEAELKEVIKFYESPAGKKFAEKTPLITQESMEVGQTWGRAVGQRIVTKLQEKGY